MNTIATTDQAPRALLVSGELEISSRVGEISVIGRGDSVEIRPASFATAIGLLRTRPALVPSRGTRRLDVLTAGLRRAGMTVELKLGNRRLARLGSRARPNLLARAAGMPAAELTWPGVGVGILALLGRRSDV